MCAHHYTIRGYFPPPEFKLGFNGFSVELDADLARKALNMELSDQARSHFEECARDAAKGVFPKILEVSKGLVPVAYYSFVELDGKPTMLLHYCKVPGNACELGLETGSIRTLTETNIESVLTYEPHNVDTIDQAYLLLAMWLRWANDLEDLI